MIGGSALAFFGEPSIFFIFELGGVVFLFLGFIYSDRFIKARESTITEAREKRGIESCREPKPWMRVSLSG
jgi:hypothetical protein